MLDAFGEEALRGRGFTGFTPFRDLKLDNVPPGPGIYAVLRGTGNDHEVLESSGGGHFKGKNPTADPMTVRLRLDVPSALLYVGKADSGSRGTRGLRARIAELTRFGRGEPVGHWGGRYLWQLSDAQALRVAWLPVGGTTAREAESSYFDEFIAVHGQLPFANLRR